MGEYRKSFITYCIFCIIIAGLAGFTLQISFQQEEDKARLRVEKTSFLIGEWIKGSFKITDYLLRDILGHVEKDDLIFPHPDTAAQKAMTDKLIEKMESVPDVILVGLFDEDCVITHVNNNEVGWDGSKRDYCTELKNNPNRNSYVTNAFVSTAGPLNVTQSREFLPETPGFQGFAAVGVNLDFFSHWLDQVEIGDHGVLAITDGNLSLISRQPNLPEALGKTVNDPIVANFLSSGEISRTFRETSPLDGEPRLYSVRKIEDLPFAIVVGEADQDWQAGWMQHAQTTAGIVLMLWLIAFMALRYYWSHLNIMTDLKDARDALHALSITDPLTGLANRRHFEASLDKEVQRAKRNQTATSILLIDVDYFKPYNDTYGHPQGDECLQRIAAIIKNALKRSQDLAARYGGEEFICLLPETDRDSAIKIAEAIKTDIISEAIEHSGSDIADHVTASFGLSVYDHKDHHTFEDLIKAADDHLYWAKENGRNCIGYGQNAA